MNRIIYALLFLIALFVPAPSHAWLIYYKPAFHGRVIDAETKEPIEGAVVVVEYFKKTAGPFESMSSVTGVREALTDKNGEFHFPRYFTIVGPLSWTGLVDFIIYKPGYGNFFNDRVYPPKGMDTDFEEYFSRAFGLKKEVQFREPYKAGIEPKKITVIFGLVELPELKTKEERLKAIPGGPTGYRAKDLPLLFKEMNEEYRRFGLGEIN